MTQNQQILKWLKPVGRTITSLQALKKFGCMRLASRIQNLEDEGYKFRSEMVTNKKTGKRYSKYSML